MRIVFMGSPHEVLQPLQSLLQYQKSGACEVVGIVSQPARPVGRKQVLTDPPVAAFAKEKELPVWQPERASSLEFMDQLRTLKPDVIITAAYGQILSQSFLEIPQRATINIHPSLLPKYRGATPVQSALLAGEATTGVTILFTVRKMDAGAIILQKPEAIHPEEKADALLARMFNLSSDLLIEALKRLEDPNFSGMPQDEEQVTHCQKFNKTDGNLNYENDAITLYNRFRAFYPWPGTYTHTATERVVIEDMLPPLYSDDIPLTEIGSFQMTSDGRALAVKCQRGILYISQLKPAGGRSMSAAEFMQRLQNKRESLSFTASAPT